jgi:uncharacterized protein YegP (UPF0339 family)
MRIYQGRDRRWRWRFSVSSDITADSSEGDGYPTKAGAKRAAVAVVLAMHGPIKWIFEKARKA